jgi:hypothetical protein
MTNQAFILIVYSLCFFTCCKNDKQGRSAVLPFTTREQQNSLCGEWRYSSSIWYTSELNLRNDGTFQFHDQGCYGQNFTEGTWSMNNRIIFLTSFQTYKKPEDTHTEDHGYKIQQPKNHRYNKRGLITDFHITTAPKIHGPADTIRVYFNSIQLTAKGDTLYCDDKSSCIGEHQFTRLKTN